MWVTRRKGIRAYKQEMLRIRAIFALPDVVLWKVFYECTHQN